MDNFAKTFVPAIQHHGAERKYEKFIEEDDLMIIEEAASLLREASEGEKRS